MEITSKEILFPHGYFFKQSPVHKTKKIDRDQISEINLNTYPPSLVYHHNEIIFLRDESKEELEIFAKNNSIPVVDRFDIWEHINRPFLDTEFEEYEKSMSIQQLDENGISKSELNRIRIKAGKTMCINFLVWEWIYLGLFDYLSWTWLYKKKYWWAMDVGLRNYKNKSNIS